jgi:hypothetical protein
MGLQLVFVDFDRTFGGRAPNPSRTIDRFKRSCPDWTPAKLAYTSDLEWDFTPNPALLWYPAVASSADPYAADWGDFVIWFRWHGAPRNGGHWRLGDAPMRYLLEDYI